MFWVGCGLCLKKNSHKEALEQEWYVEYFRFIQLAGKRPRTEKCYLNWIRQLSSHYPEHQMNELSRTQVLDYLLFLQRERQLAPSTVNQAVQALKSFYMDHLGLKWRIWSKVHIKRREALPHVMSSSEVDLLLSSFRDGRYRAFFTVLYQCGMRINEAVRLHPQDIDGTRLIIRVRDGKGGMDREIPITPELYTRLRTFWKWHRNPEFLFPAPGRCWQQMGKSLSQALYEGTHPIGKTPLREAFNHVKHECGLMKKHQRLTPHTLRHSFATHMLEAGCTIKQLSLYLGHRDLRTTMVYLHLTEVSETKGREALQSLATGQKKKRRS